jgi:hypothetical protein
MRFLVLVTQNLTTLEGPHPLKKDGMQSCFSGRRDSFYLIPSERLPPSGLPNQRFMQMMLRVTSNCKPKNGALQDFAGGRVAAIRGGVRQECGADRRDGSGRGVDRHHLQSNSKNCPR